MSGRGAPPEVFPTGGAAGARCVDIGFLGLGWIGQARMRSVLKVPGVRCAAIADVSPASLEQARVAAPQARVFSGLDDLLGEKLDGVVIATPSALHARQAIRVLDAGLAVFCQKPLGRSSGEVRDVVEAARRNDRLLGVDLCYREVEGMRIIRALVSSGELGSVFAADLVFHNAYGPDKPWYYDPAQSGGGCMLDLGIHLVDLLLWTLDFPKATVVSSRLLSGGRPLEKKAGRGIEDFARVLLDLDGATAAVSCSWNLPAGRDAVIEAAFYGTRGGAQLRNVNGSFFDFEALHFAGTAGRVLAGPPDDWGAGAVTRWIGELGRGGRYDPGIARSEEVAHVIDDVYKM